MSYHWWTDPDAFRRKEASKTTLERSPVSKHPLDSGPPQLVKVQSPPQSLDLLSSPLDNLDDPLTTALKLSELDPLTRMAVVEESSVSSVGGGGIRGGSLSLIIRPDRDTFEPWSCRKGAILSKFTTQEKLSITTSSFATPEEVRGVSEKTLHRLEQLDFDTGSRQFFGGLTQDEYVAKINQFDKQMTEAWNSDMRVNALKIAIQCCKLLGDTTVLSFYPSKFVIITDILDKFGSMVYTRLKGKQSTDALPAEVAKETCKNWFFKVGSIRELLPRLCIDLSILKSYSFINPNPEYNRILSRLLNCMWGIGDPVVAIYLRCYLCRVAMDLIPNDKELFMKCVQDLLLLHDQVLDNFRTSPHLSDAKISMDTYMTVLSPALDWIVNCLVHRGEHLHYVLQLVSNVPPFWKSVLLNSVLATYPPSFISEECINILDMILTVETNMAGILKNLGLCLIIVQPHAPHSREIWPKVWSLIRKIHSRDPYLDCATVWMEFVVKNFGPDQVSTFIDDIMNHVSLRSAEQCYGKLSNVVEKLLTFSPDITYLLRMNKFVKMVSILPVDNAKGVLQAFNSKHPNPLGDNVIISTLMHFAVMLHDSVDALTPVDEVKQIGAIINTFILRVNYSRDYEKQLQFYDDARGAFSNIDAILVELIQGVCRLGMEVGYLVEGHHTKRTRGFLSACIAYAFITIPSLENCYAQLQLYHLASQVAYANQCVSQGDACLKAAINLLNENKEEFDCGEPLLVEFVCNLLSTLLAVPDHPKETMLYLLKALMTIQWSSQTPHIRYLSLLGAYAQPEYPYSFTLVETNADLYGGAQEFIEEVNSLGAGVLNDVLTTLKDLGDQRQLKVQATLCLQTFWEIIHWGDLGQVGMTNLALNLWNLARNHTDPQTLNKALESLRRKADRREELQSLCVKLSQS